MVVSEYAHGEPYSGLFGPDSCTFGQIGPPGVLDR